MGLISTIRSFYHHNDDVEMGTLTKRAARRYFRRQGWTVFVKCDGFIDFFARKHAATMVSVCVCDKIVDRFLIDDMAQKAARWSSCAIVLSAKSNGVEVQKHALYSRVVLLEWAKVSELEQRLATIDKTLREANVAAKISKAARLPRGRKSLRLQLTASQTSNGFLFATTEVSAWFVDRGGDTLLVSFAHWGSNPDNATRWGAAYAEHMGLSILGFETSSPSWYPEEHVVEGIEASLAVLGARFKRRLLFGASQGGFAALKYSGLLGASAVLAFSPPFSIDPTITFDARFSNRYVANLNSGMHIGSDDVFGELTVCYDPYDASDAAHAAEIARHVVFTPVAAPFSGHAPSHLLGDVSAITKLLELALAGDSHGIQATVRDRRRENPMRPFNMALHLAPRRPGLACDIFEAYRDGPPGAAWAGLCYHLSEAGQAARVVDWLQAMVSAAAPDAERSCCLALVALNAGRLDLAFDACSAAIAASPLEGKYIYVQDLVIKARSGIGKRA